MLLHFSQRSTLVSLFCRRSRAYKESCTWTHEVSTFIKILLACENGGTFLSINKLKKKLQGQVYFVPWREYFYVSISTYSLDRNWVRLKWISVSETPESIESEREYERVSMQLSILRLLVENPLEKMSERVSSNATMI